MLGSAAPTDVMFALRGQLARTLNGLTWRRLGVVLLFVACQSIFSWQLALAASRGASILELARVAWWAMVATTIWVIPSLLAGLAAYNRVRLWNWARVLVMAAVIGAVTWYTQIAALAIQPVPGVRFVEGWVANAAFVAMVVALLLYTAHVDDAAHTLEREELGRIDLDRGLAEARLLVAQAQIEPHFLFNTLANVRRLYQIDPAAATAMLREFSIMLGAALPSMRLSQSTLGRELALALAYLSVQKIRMGERLEYEADVPDGIRPAELPPLMLSTLVENAIKHGLAPLRQGGRVRISAQAIGGVLRVCVADTGGGLAESTGPGVGLANIESRLASGYGGAASLDLLQNDFGGVTACIELPLRLVAPLTDRERNGVAA